MSRRGSNIYKRTDGRYKGRIKLGYDEKKPESLSDKGFKHIKIHPAGIEPTTVP